MKGWGWEKLHHPDHLPRVIAFMTEAWTKNIPFELIHLLRGKDGNYRWFLSQGTPICDNHGVITEWIGTLTDIDEQKRGEERFRLLADEAPLWVWLTDQDAQVDYANKEMLAFFNAGEVEVLNRQRLLGSVHADDLAHTTRINENGYVTRSGYTLECRMFNNNSRQYEWFALKTVPRLIEGRFHGFIGTATNIHVQKTYQAILEQKVEERTAALNKANAALQHSNQELLQFAHIASHDMKEPLRKISVFTELLQKQLDNGDVDKAKEYAGRVASSTQRMNVFIESVLKYASIESHKAESVPVDLNQLVQEVETDIELALKDKNGTIIIKDILPVVNGIPVLLHQLFYNLINNALKFSKKHIPAVIELSTGMLATGEVAAKGLDHHRRYIVICVKDNGIGFDQSHAKKIFDTYYRLNLKEKYEGTGLGLSLCKKIVERHGGAIEAEGISGEGALFKVILPLG
jgi:signal transduction histidine kinase